VQPFLDATCFVADWRKIGERRQSLTDRGNQRKNAMEEVVAQQLLMVNPT
jgi:hypothetical protein